MHTILNPWLTQITPPPPRSSGFLLPVTLYISQDIEIAIPGSTCRRAFTTVWGMP